MAHRPGHRAGGGSRRGQFGRSQGGGTDRAGNRYRDAGGVAGGYGEVPRGGGGWGNLLGGLGSMLSAKQMEKIARENREWQERQNTIAYERSLPWSSYGPAGNVEFDPETKQIMSTLAPEYQNLMDQWLGTSGMATTELQGMMGDPYAMEQQQMARFDAMNAQRDAQARAQQQEAMIAQGRGGTQGYYDQLAVEDAINQRRLGEQVQSMRTGMDYRQMLGAESQGFGQNAMIVAGMLRPDADLGSMVGARTKPGMNMAGLSLAGTNYADTKSGFWSGMQDQAGLYNNAGQMTQAPQQGWLSGLMGAGKQFFSFLR